MSEQKETDTIELTETDFPQLGDLRTDLRKSLTPRSNANHGTLQFMIDWVNGFKFEMNFTEHPPPHFHVSFNGKKASYSIQECELITPTEVRRKEQRVIERWCAENKNTLIERWNESRPSNCPVGPIQDSDAK